MDKVITETIGLHKGLVDDFERRSSTALREAANIITDCFLADKTLYLCGNGGSAADCQHIAGEFVGRFRRERKALSAIALSTNTSILTCIGNDYNYNYVFARQVEASVRQGDVLWAFSTSGTSANVIAAVEEAKLRKAKIVAFTGKADTPLEKLADVCICANSDVTSASQEIHLLAYHIICDLVEQRISDGK